MNLCLICLRTDRLLKNANNVLEEFHDELCDFSVITTASSCFYCNECEYLLMKFYKFKEKCIEALKIYKKWKMTRSSKKQPINLLYTLLPPSTLGMWSPNPKIGTVVIQSTDSQTDLCVEEELLKDEYTKEVKLEVDQNSNENINDIIDDLKTEDNSKNVSDSEQIDEISNDSGTEKDLLLEKLEKILEDDSDESVDLNVPKESEKIKAKVMPKKLSKKIALNIDEISKDSETHLLIEKVEKFLEDDSDESTELNVTKVENSEKIKAKLKPQNSRKKMTPKSTVNDKVKEDDNKYRSVFEIEYLTTPEMKVEEFERRKTYECYVTAEHKCEICYQVFKSSKFLEYHINKWHNESPGSTLCPICKTWNSARSSHKLSHLVVFKCKLCPLVTPRRCSMKKHFEWHTGKKYSCEQCKLTYKSQSAYYAHNGRFHRRGRNVCECCGRGFLSPLGLKIHKNNSTRCTVSTEPSTFQTEPTEGVRCDECDVTLPSQEVYDAHVYDVHDPPRGSGDSTGLPGIRIYKRESTTRTGIRRNYVKQTCRVCNTVGVNFRWLQQHFRREHPNEDIDVFYADKKTHLCDICGTGFTNIYHLRDHMHLHTGARPYACDLCPKRFRSALQVREHRRRHFPSAIPCAYCDKLFKTTSNLSSHVKTHKGEKNHKCDICGKRFVQTSTLKAHVRGVHNNIRRVKRGGADTGAKRTKRRKTVPDDTETENFGDSE